MDRIGDILRRVNELRRRIARNKTVRDQSNRRLDEQLRYVATDPSDENRTFSEAVRLGNALSSIGSPDPFDWSFEPPVDSCVYSSYSIYRSSANNPLDLRRRATCRPLVDSLSI